MTSQQKLLSHSSHGYACPPAADLPRTLVLTWPHDQRFSGIAVRYDDRGHAWPTPRRHRAHRTLAWRLDRRVPWLDARCRRALRAPSAPTCRGGPSAARCTSELSTCRACCASTTRIKPSRIRRSMPLAPRSTITTGRRSASRSARPACASIATVETASRGTATRSDVAPLRTRWSRSCRSASPRPLMLRPRLGSGGHGETLRFELGHGDLLVMGGSCQRTWEHGVPKSARPTGPRISVQFRTRGVR